MHTLQVGRFALTAVPVQPESLRPPAQFFPGADAAMLEATRARLPEAFGSSVGELRFGQSLCVLRGEDGVTLVDAGLPPSKDAWPLMDALKRMHINPDDVTRVFITHRDLDHIGGLSDRRKRDGGITFRNAQHLISGAEYAAFKGVESFTTIIAPLEDAGLLEVIQAAPLEGVDAAPEFAPGLKAVLTPGHRSGATSVLVNGVALLTADVLHAAFQVTHPEVSIMFDEDKALAAQTRTAVVDLAAQRGWLLHVPHLPPFGVGRVVEEAGARYWQAVY
jgi:glyoxylase-like metal-dependent hydrolase (beta-lactamase superfamily II)